MIKKLLKYVIITLFIVNLPTVALNNFGATFGAVLSYSSFLLLILYYTFYLIGRPPNYWLLFLGIAYFIISGLNLYNPALDELWFVGFVKYLILMIFGNGFFKEVTKKEMIFFLMIGTFSVIATGFFIPSDYGRASGFYYNANPAGLACLFGYVLTYSMPNKVIRQVLQIIFTLGGIVTFSRTFIIVWVLINLVSIKKSRKNIRPFAIGIVAFITLFVAGELLNLGGERFETFKAAISSDKQKSDLSKDSRTGTWSRFYEHILDAPVLGNGYRALQGNGIHRGGVHNTYLLIVGEAGIIPLVIFCLMFLRLTKTSWKYFKQDETLFYMALTLGLYLMTLHDFFEYPFMLSIILFWFNQTELIRKKELPMSIPSTV